LIFLFVFSLDSCWRTLSEVFYRKTQGFAPVWASIIVELWEKLFVFLVSVGSSNTMWREDLVNLSSGGQGEQDFH
jgi:hypothetical protein